MANRILVIRPQAIIEEIKGFLSPKRYENQEVVKEVEIFHQCSNLTPEIHNIFALYFRNANQPVTHHGQAGPRLVRAFQSSHGPRRPGRGDQQEVVAGGHQGIGAAILHHIRSIHIENAVSFIQFTRIVATLMVGMGKLGLPVDVSVV